MTAQQPAPEPDDRKPNLGKDRKRPDLEDLPPMGEGDPPRDPLRPPVSELPELAGSPQRLAARLIDWVLAYLVTWLLISLIWGFDEIPKADMTVSNTLIPAVVQVGLAMIYEAVMLMTRGRTLGKMALRIRVARLTDGEIPHGSIAWIRSAVLYLPLLVPVLGFLIVLLNVLWQLWDRPYKQCLHDKAAGTVVAKGAAPAEA